MGMVHTTKPLRPPSALARRTLKREASCDAGADAQDQNPVALGGDGESQAIETCDHSLVLAVDVDLGAPAGHPPRPGPPNRATGRPD